MRGLVVAALLAGCASEGRPLRDWTRDADGASALTLRLPARLGLEGPHSRAFALRTEVVLTGDERGRPLTFVFDNFPALGQLSANGTPLEDRGDRAVGEHRFVIPAELTRAPSLALQLSARTQIATIVGGIGNIPRLLDGDKPAPGSVATFNRNVSIINIALCLIFTLIFGTRFALDRRRLGDAAFAVQAFTAVPAAIMLSFWSVLPLVVALVTSMIAGLAAVYFVHFEFQLGAAPRWLIRLYLAVILAYLSTAWSVSLLVMVMPFASVAGLLWNVYLVYRLVLVARSRVRRVDAFILLVPLGASPILLTVVPLLVWLGHPLWPGVMLTQISITLWAGAQALVIARQDVAGRRSLEAAAEQLRSDVAERSRQLADALARLAQAKSEDVAPGATVEGRYRIVKPLGAGGMGTVHEVERITDGRRMALKTLRGRVDAEAMARFAREAQLAAQLQHPNLVPVHDVGVTAGGTLFLVMELIDGGSLEGERKRFGDARWALPLLAQIAGGLEAMHARGIIHRDLKPANVLLQRGVPRIADFGLAVLRSDDALADTAAAATLSSPDSPPLTRAGAIIGTPFYMAPELVAGAREARAAADVFAFGVMAYQMICGKAPFVEAPLMAKLGGKPLAPAAPLRSDGLGAAAALIDRCLALDPAARPTAAELRALA
jgi:hypothetical protein